ncbi:DUF1566 domain-containing protein [Vibrio vulnificus]|uniref:Lcl C-terminal domain-containing protein n=1 Tax=Vibrio vulnificus TaxID=672 RepID=UPI003ED93870
MLKINHHWPRAWVLLVLLLAANGQVQADLPASTVCPNGYENTAIAASTPNTAFSDNGDGTVAHHTTGLIWQRCSLGQSWDGTDCTGTATTFTWQQALAAATQDALAGFSDWRLPNKKELASIVEYRCYQPAINSQPFPNTPSALYWSSSPITYYSDRAWLVYFLSGEVSYHNKDSHYRVRLVRDAQ